MSDTYYYPRGFTYPPVIVPDDYPVRPLAYTEQPTGRMTCGNCGLSWDDDIVTGITPVPSGRCPFEYFHPGADDADTLTVLVTVEWQSGAITRDIVAAADLPAHIAPYVAPDTLPTIANITITENEA